VEKETFSFKEIKQTQKPASRTSYEVDMLGGPPKNSPDQQTCGPPSFHLRTKTIIKVSPVFIMSLSNRLRYLKNWSPSKGASVESFGFGLKSKTTH